MFHQLWYLVGEAVKGIHRSKLSSVTSIITIGISTSILGIFCLLLYSALKTAQSYDQEVTLRAYIQTSHEGLKKIEELREIVTADSAIDSIHFISKSEALNEFRENFDEELLGVLKYNPLPPSFKVWPSVQNHGTEQMEALRTRLQAVPGVESVSEQSAYQLWKNKWRNLILSGSLFLLIFIGFAVSLIISNAVKLNLLARKSLVDSMRYCGASAAFIVFPFIIEGFIIGALGSIAGIGIGYFYQKWVPHWIPDLIMPSLWIYSFGIIAFTSVLAMGSGFLTVRKFLKS